MPGRGRPFKKGQEGLGGVRPGSGAKPGPIKELRRLKLLEMESEAEKSLEFEIRMRDNPEVEWGLRHAASVEIMNRVWGKPKQAVELSGKDGESLPVVITVQIQGDPR